MLDILFAHAPGPAATALADELVRRLEALRAEDSDAYPIALTRDPGAAADELGPVFILINDEAVVGGEPDAAIRQAIAAAHDGEHPRLLVPIVADGAPGLMESLDLGADRYRAIPQGGAGVGQVPFNGVRDLWLDAAFAEARLVIDRAVRGRQMAGLDLAAEAEKCRAAALAMDQAALSEAEALGEDALAAVRLAATSLNLALDGDPIPVLATPLRLIGQAIDLAGEKPAPATGAALNDAFVKVSRLERAGADAGRPRSRDSRAPTRFVKVEKPVGVVDPANAENAIDQANVQAGQRLAAEAIEALVQGSAADDPLASREVRAAARDLGRIERLAALTLPPRETLAPPMTDMADGLRGPLAAARTRRYADVTWIDVTELEATVAPRENAVRALVEAASRKGLSVATRTLIKQTAGAVRRVVLTSVRRLAARALGRPQPPRPDRRNPGVVWRSRVPGVDPSGWPMMVTLPPGRFQMGSPKTEIGRFDDEQPRHRVTIADTVAFGIGPVTFAMWDAAIAAGAELVPVDDEGWGRGARPVINVSWEDARAYVVWMNGRLGLDPGSAYRLPTEAEWEYACRAGTTTPFSFGSVIGPQDANFNGGYGYGDAPPSGVRRGQTTPVGEFAGNDFGLYDMHGNVLEWCEDVWHDDYKGAPTDGSAWVDGDSSRRVLRGGSWSNSPRGCRSAFRNRDNPTDRFNFTGFRLARTLLPPPS